MSATVDSNPRHLPRCGYLAESRNFSRSSPKVSEVLHAFWKAVVPANLRDSPSLLDLTLTFDSYLALFSRVYKVFQLSQLPPAPTCCLISHFSSWDAPTSPLPSYSLYLLLSVSYAYPWIAPDPSSTEHPQNSLSPPPPSNPLAFVFTYSITTTFFLI